jgi:hypothetical protein
MYMWDLLYVHTHRVSSPDQGYVHDPLRLQVSKFFTC